MLGSYGRAGGRPCASARCWADAARVRRCSASSRMPLRKPGRVMRSCIAVGIVAVDAGDRVLGELGRLDVGLRVEHLKALEQLLHACFAGGRHLRSPGAPAFEARLAVHVHHAGVAVQAGTRLGLLVHAFGLALVGEHVGVAALFAIVDAQRRSRRRCVRQPGRYRDAGTPRCRRSGCGRCPPCAGSCRTGAGSSCPTRPGRRRSHRGW